MPRKEVIMPNFLVKVQYSYPVCAKDPKNALSTVPIVIKARFIGFRGEGTTEILDADGKVVLTAKLMTKPREKCRK